MLSNCIWFLNSKKIILGSRLIKSFCSSTRPSPRPGKNYQQLKFETKESCFEENLNKSHYPNPKDYVLATSKGKMSNLTHLLDQSNEPWDILITCDTILISAKDELLEKPVC